MIAAAAGRLFGERGFAATRLEDIAAAAGVTKPILYRHFGSKQDLYLALLRRHRDDLRGFTELIPAEGTLEQRLRPVLETWIDYVEERSYGWRMLFRDPGGGPQIAAFRAEVHALARSVLADAIGELTNGAIGREERESLSELLSMGMAGLVLWWIEDAAVSREAVIDAMARVWTRTFA